MRTSTDVKGVAAALPLSVPVFAEQQLFETRENHLEIHRPVRRVRPRPGANEHWRRLRVLAYRMSRGVRIGRHKRRFKTLENVFTGTDAVSWLMADRDNLATTTLDGIHLGQQLIDNGFVQRISMHGRGGRAAFAKRVFKTGQHFYRFKLEHICPHTLTAVVVAARNMKRMDIDSANDAYVELTVGYQERATSVIMNTETPIWRDQAFTFGITDPLSEHLKVSVMDYDQFTSDDFIGRAEVSLIDVYRACDETEPQELMQHWRALSDEELLNEEGVELPTDRGWINLYDKKGALAGQIRLALSLRDFDGRAAEKLKSTLQAYTLHCRVFGIEGVQEQGGSWEMWLGRKMGFSYLASVEVQHDEDVARSPWKKKSAKGHASFSAGSKDVGVPLRMDIEANVVIGRLRLAVRQKLPTESELGSRIIADGILPLDRVPVIYDFGEASSAHRHMAKLGVPVPVSIFHVTNGTQTNHSLEVQNGRIRAAIWMELQANNILGPVQDEKLALRPFQIKHKLARTVVHEALPVGLERFYAAMSANDTFLFHVLYDEVLYSRIQIEPWEMTLVAPDRFNGLDDKQRLPVRGVRFTIPGIANLGSCRVEQTQTLLPKSAAGFGLHLVSRFLEMPFGDKFREHTLLWAYQDRSDAHVTRLMVTCDVDLSLDGGPPLHIHSEIQQVSADRAQTIFHSFMNVVVGATVGSRNHHKKLGPRKPVAMVITPAQRYRYIFFLLLRLTIIVGLLYLAVGWAASVEWTHVRNRFEGALKQGRSHGMEAWKHVAEMVQAGRSVGADAWERRIGKAQAEL